MATINSNSHPAGDAFPIESYIENAQLMKFLLDNASHLDVAKGWSCEKTNTYYFINGEPNFVLTQLGAYLPNFKVTKQASAEEMASVAKVVQDKVVAPGESQALLIVDTVLEETELLKMTDSEAFLKVLGGKTYTDKTNFIYNFESSATGNKALMTDFNGMNLSNVKSYPNGRLVGELPNGDIVNIHPSTKLDGVPTLEIQDVLNKRIKIKIRY